MSLSPLCHALTNDLHVSTVGPASTTVSHGFTVAWHSSPPFGSCRCVLALKTTSLGRELRWPLQTSPQGGSGRDGLSKPKDGPCKACSALMTSLPSPRVSLRTVVDYDLVVSNSSIL